MKKLAFSAIFVLLFAGHGFSQAGNNDILQLKQGKDIYLTFELRSDKVTLEPVQCVNICKNTEASML